MSDDREYDIVIFGVSGFVGRYALLNLLSAINNNDHGDCGTLKIAVSGRDPAKIGQAFDFVSRKLSMPIDKVTSMVKVIIASVSHEDSLNQVTRKTKVLASTVGPYTLYGEPVVKACIDSSTHYVDVTGEVNWVESMQLKYHSKAIEQKSYIVSCCAYESLLSESILLYCEKLFPNGSLEQLDISVSIKSGNEGFHLNHGTLDSALAAVPQFFAFMRNRKQLFQRLYPKPIPAKVTTIDGSGFPWLRYDEIADGITVPFMDPDTAMISKANAHKYNIDKERPVRFSKYAALPSYIVILQFILFFITIGPLILFDFGRQLIMKYPRVLTFGIFSKEGPSEAIVDATKTRTAVKAYGYVDRKIEPTASTVPPPDKKVVLIVNAPEPTYPLTSQLMIQSAITLARDPIDNNLPGGGFYSPSTVFRNTSLVQRIQDATINKVSFQEYHQ